jgi:taurine dioxygenase
MVPNGRVMHVMERATNGLGVVVSGLAAEDATEGSLHDLRRLVYLRRVVVLKDQHLTTNQFVDFSKRLGTPVPYLQENYHHPEHPLIFVSSNVRVGGRKIGVARTGGFWHSDTAFQQKPVPLTLLYPQIVPKLTARSTLFIDLERACRELPPSLKERLEGRVFLHSGRWKYKVREQDAGFDISEILAMIDRVQPPARHPAILVHPVTAERGIYATRGFTVGVEGLHPRDGEELLSEIFDFVEQDRFITAFTWEPGDIILWDNRLLAHRASRDDSANGDVAAAGVSEEDTLVYRILIDDGHPIYLNAPSAPADAEGKETALARDP